MTKTLFALAVAALSLPSHAQLTSAGDLMFTSFNADEDGFAMVALADISANTKVYFTDNEWSGSAFNTGESYSSWVSGAATIAAGTVIRFSKVDSTTPGASIGTFARETVSGSTNWGISTSEDTIYAYLASSASATPTLFLSAVTSGTYGSASAGSLDNTGLTASNGAITLSAGSDYAEYNGVRTGQTTFAGYKSIVSNAANWNDLGTSADGTNLIPNTTAFTVTAVPEPETYALMLSGLLTVGFVARRRRG